MSITKLEVRILEHALDNLDPRRPKFRGSDKVREMLSDPDLSLYLQSWVISHVGIVARQEKGTINALRRYV